MLKTRASNVRLFRLTAKDPLIELSFEELHKRYKKAMSLYMHKKHDSWRSLMEQEDVTQELTIQLYKWFQKYDHQYSTFTYYFNKNCEFFFKNIQRKSITRGKNLGSSIVSDYDDELLTMQEMCEEESSYSLSADAAILLEEAGIKSFPMLTTLTELMVAGYKPQEIKSGSEDCSDFCMDKNTGKIYRLFDKKSKKPLFYSFGEDEIIHNSGQPLKKSNLVRLESRLTNKKIKPKDVNQALEIIRQSLQIQKTKQPKKKNGWESMNQKRHEYCVKNNMSLLDDFLVGLKYNLSANGLVLTIIDSEDEILLSVLSVFKGKVTVKTNLGNKKERLIIDLSSPEKFHELISRVKKEKEMAKADIQQIRKDIISFITDSNPDVVAEAHGGVGVIVTYEGKRIARIYRIHTDQLNIQTRIHNGKNLDPMKGETIDQISEKIGKVVEFFKNRQSGAKKVKSNFKIRVIDGVNYLDSFIPDVNMVRESKKVLYGALTEAQEIIEAIGVSNIEEIKDMPEEEFQKRVVNNEKAFEEVVDLMVYIQSAAYRVFGDRRIKDKLKAVILKNEARGYYSTQSYDRDEE